MESFRQGTFRFLVATDVAARGIDVADLELVVNYDLPYEAEDNVHPGTPVCFSTTAADGQAMPAEEIS